MAIEVFYNDDTDRDNPGWVARNEHLEVPLAAITKRDAVNEAAKYFEVSEDDIIVSDFWGPGD